MPPIDANEFNFNVRERAYDAAWPADATYEQRETEMQTEKEQDEEKTKSGAGRRETPRTLNAY